MTDRVRRYRTNAEDLVPMAWHSPWTPTEREFEALFVEVADAKGWLGYHTRDSRGSRPGFPDWTLVHVGQRRIIFVELKGFGGKPSDEQRAWLEQINEAGGEGYLVTTTCDYARDAAAIAELLTARPARQVATGPEGHL